MNNNLYTSFLHQLITWHEEMHPGEKTNDLSVLKIQNLFFLTLTQNPSLIESLNFTANRFGVFESGLTNFLYEHTQANNSDLPKESLPVLTHIHPELSAALMRLKKINPELIKVTGWKSKLIAQKWAVVSRSFEFARLMGQKSYPLKKEGIMSEPLKFYSL